jgi:3alpha(or 20beta)-hydroxysteroid dehydrogenase
MGRVSGKVALISGGARGLGASHARVLVQEGAKVVIGDLLDTEGNALVVELGAENVKYVHLDVRKFDDWENAVKAAVESFGRLDILVNNAGISSVATFEEYTVEQWQRIMDINLTGVFHGIKAAVPQLKLSGNASIINISSIAGIQGYEKAPGYNATKFGVRGLTKNAALDLGRYNIRVNSLHPGLIRTQMTEGLDYKQSHVALHRVGEPIEVSNFVLFLASDESSFATGAEFIADGGETAGLAHDVS